MSALVHCTWPNAGPVIAALRNAFSGAPLITHEEAMASGSAGLSAAHMLILGGRPPEGLLEAAPGLRAIQAMGAGIDHLLPLMAERPDLQYARVADPAMPELMADYVLAAVLRHFRRLDRYERAMADRAWRHQEQPAKADWPVGVLGLGHIGAHVAGRLADAGFSVRGWSRTPRAVAGASCAAGPDGLLETVNGLACLVLLLPLTPETEAIVDDALLSRLSPGAVLVNVARGALLDDGAVRAALADGRLSAATLDVFRTEPLPADDPYWTAPGVLVTPHVSALVSPAAAAAQIAENWHRLRRGEPLLNAIDPARGY